MSQRPDPAPVRPPGPLVWIHCGAAPPVPAVLDLARRFALGDVPVAAVITTSGEVEGVDLPGDIPVVSVRAGRARGFLEAWSPDVAVWTECDMPAGLVPEAAARGLPLILADAGTARPDLRSWRWRLGRARKSLGYFTHILAGDQAYADDLARLGAASDAIEIVGILEEGPAALPVNEQDIEDLSEVLRARPSWLAMGVLPGVETEAVLEAHRRALQRSHRLLLTLVPADPASGPNLADELAGRAWTVALRSAGEEPGAGTQIYIADTEGEAGLWYRLAPIAFLGQSLEAGGGLNPMEPASLGSAVMHGPNIRHHRAAYARLGAVGATRTVRTAAELSSALDALLAPDQAAAMAQAAWGVSSAGSAVTDRIIELVWTALEDRGLI